MSPHGPATTTTDYPDCYSQRFDENPARFIEYGLVSPLIRAMTNPERVDHWLDVVDEHYPERGRLRRQLEHQRDQIADDTVDQPTASTSVDNAPARAVADGGTTVQDGSADAPAEPDTLEYPDDETFEQQKQQARSIATTFDNIGEIHERLQDEGDRQPTRPHVIAALNERLSELREREEGADEC